jgi:hypothetical protein
MNLRTTDSRYKSRMARRAWKSVLHGRSQGQAIMLVAFAMVAILGFTALAIDGGELYLLRRKAQNAADAAIIRAVYEVCKQPVTDPNDPDLQDQVRDGAVAAADNNDFTMDYTNDITYPYTPPGSGSPNKDYVYVQVKATKPTRLVQVVYSGPLEVTASAVGHCNPPTKWTDGYALLATGVGCGPNALHKAGSDSTINGSLHSNSDMQLTGSSVTVNGSCSAADGGTPGGGTCTGGTNDSATIVTAPLFWNISDFAPGGKIAAAAGATGHYWSYGNDPGSLNKTSGKISNGVHYVAGDLSVNSNEFGTNSYVTIVLTGQFKMSGSGVEGVWSYYKQADIGPLPLVFTTNPGPPTSCASGAGNKAIDVSGSDIAFYGVIYGPYGNVSMSFAGNSTMNGAIIGSTMDVTGANFLLTFDPNLFPPAPGTGGVVN